jgi:flagellin
MALTVNTNVASLTAQRNLTGSQSSLSTSLERLSSGLRINSAKDDAAGLAISERFTAQIRGLNQGVRNANDGISLAQTAEGALKEVTSNLQRIRELAVQSANATNSNSDRASLQVEVNQLVAEIERVAANTSFNGIKLLDGNFSSKSFQVGPNSADTVSITSIASARTTAIGGGTTTTYAASFTGTQAASSVGATAFSSTMNLNDVALGASVSDGVSVASGGVATDTYSALAKKNAINAISAQTGVTADARTEFTSANAAAADTGAGADSLYDIALNGVYITFTNQDSGGANSAAVDTEATISDAITQINAKTTETGVVAGRDASTGKLTLTAADGRNIVISEANAEAGNASRATSGLTVLGLSAGQISAPVNTGYLTLSSTSGAGIQFTDTSVSAAAAGSVAADATNISRVGANFANVASTGTSSTLYLSAVDVSSDTGAIAALDALDGALDTINSTRADLGAYQNRFESVVANLQTTAENLSASRSRIVDADFASETANLTKSQILQQSGIAMLAQANALPQNVLALLQ